MPSEQEIVDIRIRHLDLIREGAGPLGRYIYLPDLIHAVSLVRGSSDGLQQIENILIKAGIS